MRSIIAGNWKMNKDRAEAQALAHDVVAGLGASTRAEVIISPAFPFLAGAVATTVGSPVKVSAQNCHEEAKGAYTGEVSIAMLKSLGVSHCIVGHSERRQHFGETDAAIGRKVTALLDAGMTPIFCCGERKEERLSGIHHDIVTHQMKGALGGLSNERLKRVVIAYEPVWAIGTGLNATADQAQDMHGHIRMLLHTHGPEVASAVPVLYGGSCNPGNAAELFACPDVNGGLIGGASLVADQFLELVRIVEGVKA